MARLNVELIGGPADGLRLSLRNLSDSVKVPLSHTHRPVTMYSPCEPSVPEDVGVARYDLQRTTGHGANEFGFYQYVS